MSPFGPQTISDKEAVLLAKSIRMHAGLKPGQRLSMLAVARRICLTRVSPILSAQGIITPFRGGYIITIQPRLTERDSVLAHELGHWAMMAIKGRLGRHTEADADAVARALLEMNGQAYTTHVEDLARAVA